MWCQYGSTCDGQVLGNQPAIEEVSAWADKALRDQPGSRRRVASGTPDSCCLDDWRQIVRPKVNADRCSNEDEYSERGRDCRQHPLEERADRDSEGDGEQRIGDRGDALLVEGVKSGTQCVLGTSPPQHQERDSCAPDDRGGKTPEHVGSKPVPPGNALRPRQVVSSVLELLGDQRCAPEQPEEERDHDREVHDVEDGAVAAEELALAIRAALRECARGEEAMVVVSHHDSGDEQDDGEGGEGGSREIRLTPVEPPDQLVHDATSPTMWRSADLDWLWPMYARTMSSKPSSLTSQLGSSTGPVNPSHQPESGWTSRWT